MALVVDTNILLYAANRGCPENELCLGFLQGIVATGDTCFVPENVLYEFLRVATHPRVFSHPLHASEAMSFLDALLSVPFFRVLGRDGRALENPARSDNRTGRTFGKFFL